MYDFDPSYTKRIGYATLKMLLDSNPIYFVPYIVYIKFICFYYLGFNVRNPITEILFILYLFACAKIYYIFSIRALEVHMI